jgi:hypothetical protein
METHLMDVVQDQILLTKKGEVRKRKPKKNNDYFTEETQNAIITYRETENQDDRDRIYREKIHNAFYKLSENIIHTFKFYYLDSESIEDLKYELISFMLEKLKRYDSSKGKAYSYFGTIIKRYLIVYNKKNYKNKIARVEVNEIDNEKKTIDSLVYEEFKGELNVESVVDIFAKRLDVEMFDIFQNENDLKVAVCILEMFRKREELELFNKKLIYIYIKEMVDVPTNSITRVIKRLKLLYKDTVEEHIRKMEY